MAEWLPDDVYLKLVYYAKFHRRLNLKCPVTYTEKLNWLKLHDRKMKYHEIVDKYEAKNYVAQILGDRYIIPTYGVWERFEDIRNLDFMIKIGIDFTTRKPTANLQQM